MRLGVRLRIIRNNNLIKKLKAENKKLRRNGYRRKMLSINIKTELDYECDYMGICACGCGKWLYRGMTVLETDSKMIYIECLGSYLKKNIVRL